MVVFILFLPSIALGAGFAKQSLFLSKSSVTEGDTVLIHAVVSNDAAVKFTGTLTLEDGTVKVGTVPVSLDAGEANTLSVSWKPLAGSHKVTANLKASDGSVVESESATFVIAEKPKPVPTASALASQSAAVGSSQPIQQGISNFSPAAANVTQPIFAVVDSARASVSAALDAGTAWAKEQLAQTKPGVVLGTETVKPQNGSVWSTIWYVLALLALYACTVLQFVVSSAAIFYPVLALVFLYFLWKMFRHFRRPAY